MESTVKEWLKSVYQESSDDPQRSFQMFLMKFINSLLGKNFLHMRFQELSKKHFQTLKVKLVERQGKSIYCGWNVRIVQVLQQNLM